MSVYRGMFHVVALLFMSSLLHISNGLECHSDSTILSLVGPTKCPNVFSNSDDVFCCEKDGLMYCCDIDEYAKNKGSEYIIPVVSGIVIGVVAACLICCLCCPCCMLYKRRHQGTVYGRVQQPTAIVTVQSQGITPQIAPAPNTTALPVPQPGALGTAPQVAPYPGYAGGDYSGMASMAPPPYSAVVTNEGYGKQAPYNPNFSGN